jgi:hypothetical protein
MASILGGKKTKLEIQYEKLFESEDGYEPQLPDNFSLAQPSPLLDVPSIVTYSVDEEPILGD